MTNTHSYFGIENLALTNAQRNTLVAELQSLGEQNNDPNPSRRNHWRIRPDNQAAIFEAVFNEDHLTVAATRQRLASIFNVDVALITTPNITQTVYGLLVTYRYNGVNRLRSIAFGYDGGWPAYSVSQQAARDYLIANAEAWGDVE